MQTAIEDAMAYGRMLSSKGLENAQELAWCLDHGWFSLREAAQNGSGWQEWLLELARDESRPIAWRIKAYEELLEAKS